MNCHCLSVLMLCLVFHGTVILFGHDVEMLGPPVAERGSHAVIRMVEPESALLDDPPRVCVPVIMRAPYGIKMQVTEAPCQQGRDSLWDEPLPPIRPANPVAHFRLPLPHVGGMEPIGKNQPAAAHRLACIFQHHRIHLGGCKHRTDNLQAVFHRGVGRPAGNGADVRVARIPEQSLGISILPMPEDKSFRFHHLAVCF